MKKVGYKIFYDYEAMIQKPNLHNKLSNQEVEENINSLPTELETMFDDEKTTVSIGKSVKDENILFVDSELDEDAIDERVINALKGLSLFGKKLELLNEVVIK